MIEAIRAGLAARADPAKAPDMQRYMKSQLPFYGVQKAGRVQLAREVFEPLERDEWERVVRTLWDEARFREERYMALAVLKDRRYRAHRDMAALPLYEKLIVTGAWWDLVDEVATGPLGALLPDVAPVLRAWAVDEDLWKRRAAIIAQVTRKRETDFELLQACIEPNRGDREFFIRKAIGWGLRSYAWIDPEAVVAYCETHELAPLSRREALKNVRT
ncbi:DNA alkylation repair protein [Solirubrobacter sp. CPCC 204708]|uniref:DNA alkylation repair protein n=1 Tax=Solirubrobacter deserti TaxID=2282478 RepID=A0ABT4REJ5_9ACTN|nr:DNA alkylation repair protein [Solirubrobacter deserti]MBE2318507.1 DNA alkylation repair protein [Solirubrobacter deserti]MDA0136965.1 DNA alkylation repair protein [Solirubrobacter deserti]